MGQHIDVEVGTTIGRVDTIVRLQDTLYVFEFKAGGTLEEVLAQINSKGYVTPCQAGDWRIMKAGIDLNSTTRAIGTRKTER